jgi:predicted phosphoribosyltransferase
MKERVRFLRHRGKKILLVDFSHCTAAQMFAVLEQVRKTVASQPPCSVLTLADHTGAQIDKAVATRIKEVLVLDRPYVKRSAWVGTENLPNAFYENFKNFSRREFPTFATRTAAKNWLVRE